MPVKLSVGQSKRERERFNKRETARERGKERDFSTPVPWQSHKVDECSHG